MLKTTKGFTLVELLITITIIGILSSIVIVGTGSNQKRARDAERKSDIRQYSTSLENYANKGSSLYPQRNDTAGATASTTLCGDLGITTCPEDPVNSSDPTFIYRYQSSGSASDGTAAATKYVLWAKLESTTDFWVVCSDGRVGAKAQAGFSVSGGTCPL